MLKQIEHFSQLDFSQLLQIYAEPDGHPLSHREYAGFYEDTLGHLNDPGCSIALWVVKDRYCCAVRILPYQDGFLLAGLQTLREERGKGYATALLKALIAMRNDRGALYVHIHKKNRASLRLHEKCGFVQIMDHALLLDGTVSSSYSTYCLKD